MGGLDCSGLGMEPDKRPPSRWSRSGREGRVRNRADPDDSRGGDVADPHLPMGASVARGFSRYFTHVRLALAVRSF